MWRGINIKLGDADEIVGQRDIIIEGDVGMSGS